MTSAWATGAPANSVKPMIAECSVFIDRLLGCRKRSQLACGPLLRSELDRRSKVRKISLKEGPQRPRCSRAPSQPHEDVGLLCPSRDGPIRYFGTGTEAPCRRCAPRSITASAHDKKIWEDLEDE